MKFKHIYFIIILLPLSFLSSCESYLDKSPESIVSEKDAFKTFFNFQGFVEEIYNCVPDKLKCFYNTSFNYGDDEISNIGDISQAQLLYHIDLGDYWAWQDGTHTWINNTYSNPTSTDNDDHALWPHSWYCIRKANLGIENFPLLVDATEEEKNIILGQLYFFRAWWHFELSEFFGGLPYIDTVLDSSNIPELPRLTYQEMADKIAADFRKAADLLPIDWDKTKVGTNTLGYNSMRVNKITALGYLGKTYLWAGSPLMQNGAQLGGAKTYDYNKDYCKKAAEAFGELLSLVENGATQYGLAQFKYSNIYDHERAADATSCFTDIFYTINDNFKNPGSIEAIFSGPSSDGHNSVWSHGLHWGIKINGLVKHDTYIHEPTANYVKNYGMQDGHSLDDPNTTFDPKHPFKNRDPRFYHDIIFDGFKYVNNAISNVNDESLKYCTFYTNGQMRDTKLGSRTGYLIQKLAPHQINKYDNYDDWGKKFHANLPYMRLGDIYTMYAEACAAVGGAHYKATNFSKDACDAINTLRDRVGAGHVLDEYCSDDRKFMDEVRRERAVELSFEGFRFNDLQRWLLLTEKPYTLKESQEFSRVENDDWYKTHDPKDAEVSGFSYNVILTRKFELKHYWFPFKRQDVLLYPEFKQNPGW